MLNPVLADPALFITQWYQWGVAIAFTITFITTLWIFFDSESNNKKATLWRVISLLAAIAVIPSVILSLVPELAIGLGVLPALLAFLGPIATIISLISLLFYTMRIGVRSNPAEVESLDYEPVPVAGRDEISASSAQDSAKPNTEPQTPVTNGVMQPGDDSTQVFARIPRQRQPIAWVVALNGPQTGKTYRLKELADIGRDSKHNDISLDDRTISRQHARIRQENGEFVIYDLVSANGVNVNGEMVQRQALDNGDRIVMGQIELGFMQVQEKEPTPAVKESAENGQMAETDEMSPNSENSTGQPAV